MSEIRGRGKKKGRDGKQEREEGLFSQQRQQQRATARSVIKSSRFPFIFKLAYMYVCMRLYIYVCVCMFDMRVCLYRSTTAYVHVFSLCIAVKRVNTAARWMCTPRSVWCIGRESKEREKEREGGGWGRVAEREGRKRERKREREARAREKLESDRA